MKQAVFFIVLLCSFCSLQSADQALAYDEGYDDRPQVIVKGEEAKKKFLQKKFEAAIQNGKMKKALVLAPHAKKNPNIWIKAASSGPKALSVAKECEIPFLKKSEQQVNFFIALLKHQDLDIFNLIFSSCDVYKIPFMEKLDFIAAYVEDEALQKQMRKRLFQKTSIMHLFSVYKALEALKNFEERQETVDDEKQFCTICFSNYTFQSAVATPCNHEFHRFCLLPWMLLKSPTCPFCRANIIVEDLS